MTESLILASSSPFRKAMLENAGLAVEAFPAGIDERAVELALEGTGSTAGGRGAGAGRGQGNAGQRTASGRAGARLRPDIVAGGRTFSQACRHGRGAPPSAGPVGQDASVEQRRRCWPATAWCLAPCRRCQPHHAQAVVRPSSAGIWRASATRRWRASAPTRSRARASSCSRRSRAITSPSSACRCCRCWPPCATWMPSMAEHGQPGLRLRPSDRPFALAADPWLLAPSLRHRRKLRADRHRAGSFRALRGDACRKRLCRRQCDDPAQGGGLRRRCPPRRGSRHDRRGQHALA